jgi:hypothetical protein
MPADINTCEAVVEANLDVAEKQTQVDELDAVQAAITPNSIVRITVDVLDPDNGHVAVNGFVEVTGPQINGLLQALSASTSANKAAADQALADALVAAN